MMRAKGVIEFRIITDGDKAFLNDLYADSRHWEMSFMTMPQAEKVAFLKRQYEAQDTSYKANFINAVHRIIVLDGIDIGRLIINRLDELMHIIDFTIHSSFTNRGIGSDILMALKNEAQGGKVPIELSVKKANPAKQLYERHGFKVVAEKGVYQTMRWFPDLKAKEI